MKDFMRRFGWASLALLFIVTALGGGIYAFIQGSHQSDNSQQQQNQLKGTPLQNYKPISKIPKLEIKEISKGSGTKISKAGSTVTVNYIGAFANNGTIFDDSIDSGQPLILKLSAGEAIPGFIQGLIGMKVGESREILIPSALGYGKVGNPPTIPPNSDLVFQVQVLDIK